MTLFLDVPDHSPRLDARPPDCATHARASDCTYSAVQIKSAIGCVSAVVAGITPGNISLDIRVYACVHANYGPLSLLSDVVAFGE